MVHVAVTLFTWTHLTAGEVFSHHPRSAGHQRYFDHSQEIGLIKAEYLALCHWLAELGSDRSLQSLSPTCLLTHCTDCPQSSLQACAHILHGVPRLGAPALGHKPQLSDGLSLCLGIISMWWVFSFIYLSF